MADTMKKRKKRKKYSTGLVLIVLSLIIVVLGAVLIFLNKMQNKSKKNEPVIPIGGTHTFEASDKLPELKYSDLLKGPEDVIKNAKIDASSVISNKVGKYDVSIECDNKTFFVQVEIVDTKAPAVELHYTTYKALTRQEIRASSLIKNVSDNTGCVKGIIEEKDFSKASEKLKESIRYDVAGTYLAYVVVVDEGKNYTTVPVNVIVEEASHVDYLNSGAKEIIDANTDLSQYSSEYVPYGYGSEVDKNNRPGGCNWYHNKWGQFAVDFIQPLSKYVFLTFDEGYENGNTPAILDTLKEKNARAVFFVTLSFVKSNPDLVKRMIDEGHVIGNHTATHPDGMSKLTVEEQINEIKLVHDYMLENYNYEMYLFRFPTGAFSDQSLAIVQSLGYRSVFWSFAHRDWDVNNQPDVEESLKKALDTAHGGEIFLLHGISTTDTAMLPALIDGLREKGFEIGYYARTS